MSAGTTNKTSDGEKECEDKIVDLDNIGGFFRGLAASVRNSLPSLKSSVKALGQARPLHFSSEVAVASNSVIPRYLYYG